MFISIQLVIFPHHNVRHTFPPLLFLYCLNDFFSWIPPVIIFTEYFEKHIPLPRFLGIIWNMGEVHLPESFLEKNIIKLQFPAWFIIQITQKTKPTRIYINTLCLFLG